MFNFTPKPLSESDCKGKTYFNFNKLYFKKVLIVSFYYFNYNTTRLSYWDCKYTHPFSAFPNLFYNYFTFNP